MWIRGTFLILFALTIDALQAIMSWIFFTMGAVIGAGATAVGTVGGGVFGCLAGSAVGGAGGALVGGIGAIPGAVAGCFTGGGAGAATGNIVGSAVGATGMPLGIGLGLASDICISLTMGAGLILALTLCGMYYPMSFGAAFVGEALPGLDVLPGWTALVISCIMKKNAEKKGGVASVISITAPSGVLGGIAGGIKKIGATAGVASFAPKITESTPAQERASLSAGLGKNIKNDIRPPQAANDNIPSYVQKAA